MTAVTNQQKVGLPQDSFNNSSHNSSALKIHVVRLPPSHANARWLSNRGYVPRNSSRPQRFLGESTAIPL